jgi:hypothetical protein
MKPLFNNMKTINTIIIILISFQCYGQTSFKKEKLLTEIIGFCIDSGISQYNLYNDCSEIDLVDFKVLQLQLNLSDSIFKQLVNSYNIDSSNIWNCEFLPNAKCVTKDSLEFAIGKFVLYKKQNSNKVMVRINNRDVTLKETELERAINSFYPGGVYYYISKPMIDNSENLAVIRVGKTCGSLCGYGCYYVLIKNNGRWMVKQTLRCWQN